MGWRLAGGIVLLLCFVLAMGLLVEHDAVGQGPDADASIGDLLRRHGYLAGFLLIYIEESGIPLFIPGDAFLLYVGHRLPEDWVILLAAGIGFVLAVTAGATNLYLLSRRFGRGLLEHRLARLLHLTPERMDRADMWFKRWGPWALIFGRHIPGLRVPLTVAAGIFKLPYGVFALSVAVSSAAWAGAFLALGAAFGESIERSVRSTPFLYLGSVGVICLVIAVAVIARSRRRSR